MYFVSDMLGERSKHMHVIDAAIIARRPFGERSCDMRKEMSALCVHFSLQVLQIPAKWTLHLFHGTSLRPGRDALPSNPCAGQDVTMRFTDLIPLSGSEEACQLCTVSQPA